MCLVCFFSIICINPGCVFYRYTACFFDEKKTNYCKIQVSSSPVCLRYITVVSLRPPTPLCWELIISAADYISWRCVSGPGPCIYPVAALILLYHLFMYSESRWFDICLGCSFLFSRTVRAHCSPQFFYRELRWAVLLISIIKNNNSLTYAQSIL